MEKMNVAQFATELGLPAELLLEQLQAAGIVKTQEIDPVSEKDKAKLLEHLRSAHGSNTGKITLTRRKITSSKRPDSSGKERILRIEVCKPLTFAQTAVTGAKAPLKQREANKEIVTPVNLSGFNSPPLGAKAVEDNSLGSVLNTPLLAAGCFIHKRQMEVDRCFSKANKLLPEHPAESLNNMRKACEAICKDILDETYEKKDQGKSLKPASAFTSLEDMTQELKRRKQVPIAIEKFLASLQLFGNVGSHHHDNLSERDESIMAETVLPHLKAIVDWYKGYKAFDLS
jgi:hypothetical protein